MIDKLTKDFIKKIITEINEEDNKTIINKEIILPVWKNFIDKVFPYISFLFVIYIVNLIIIIIILILILNKKN
tara:strand:+ start:834 stop:1052 length:219 start_codon:yes stop_codon:yes gene_type:complete